VGIDTTTQGNWIGVYGSDGYSLAEDAAALPGYVQLSLSGQSSWLWTGNTSDVRALRRLTGTGRFAGTWYSRTSFNIDVTMTDAPSHQVALYVFDGDKRGRTQTIDVLDATTGALLDSRTVSGFSDGQYWVWQVAGRIRFRIAHTGFINGVVSGIFFGGAPE
jgi:hypothetical protein